MKFILSFLDLFIVASVSLQNVALELFPHVWLGFFLILRPKAFQQ